jgi:hypothetical protein
VSAWHRIPPILVPSSPFAKLHPLSLPLPPSRRCKRKVLPRLRAIQLKVSPKLPIPGPEPLDLRCTMPASVQMPTPDASRRLRNPSRTRQLQAVRHHSKTKGRTWRRGLTTPIPVSDRRTLPLLSARTCTNHPQKTSPLRLVLITNRLPKLEKAVARCKRRPKSFRAILFNHFDRTWRNHLREVSVSQ